MQLVGRSILYPDHMAWISISGLPPHHQNITDISKLIIKFAHLVDVDEYTLAKTDIQKTKALIGCNSPDNIPGEFHALIGNQLCKITIEITATIVTPRDPVIP